jgi:hypothetical protein
MKPWMKTIVLVVLGFFEVVFLSVVFSSTLPHRSADMRSFAKYLNSPTPENHDLWMKEHKKTLDEVELQKFAGLTLALGDLVLMDWIAWKRRAPSTAP